MSSNNLHDLLCEVMDRYVAARANESLRGHPMQDTFRNIRALLDASEMRRSQPTLRVKSSVGQGAWARVPWVALSDTNVTATVQGGVYCVLLFAQDMSFIALTLNQGWMEPIKREDKKKALHQLKQNAIRLRKSCCQSLEARGFQLDFALDLKTDLAAERYDDYSTIAYKCYPRHAVPDDDALLRDIGAVLAAYRCCIEQG
jgi:5-methylcytosine-specific restriction protein B